MDSMTFRTEMMGTLYVTDDLEFCKTVPDDMVKIISLDEDGELNPNDPNVIVGTILLPPTEALIAESDGDEDLYDIHYIAYLGSPGVQEFIGAIISALYRHQNILLYAPMLKCNLTITKLRQHIWNLYGICIGIKGEIQCQYDARCIPIWLNMVYKARVMDAIEYLVVYPPDAPINHQMMGMLINDLRPVGESYNDRVNNINIYRKRLQENPRTVNAIYDVR